ncbi:hypothetical protein REPUB_Repub02eG0182000 [Reevesia pubescens]
MYVYASGFLNEAEKVFDNIGFKDVQCLHYLIFEYGKAGCVDKAFQVFVDMLSSGLDPSDYTFTNIISTCSEPVGIEKGRQLHGLALKYGVVNVTSLGNAVITMYGKLGMVEDAERMFNSLSERNLISWTALMSGCSGCKNLDLGDQLHGFVIKLRLGGMKPDLITFSRLFSLSANQACLIKGKSLHAYTIKTGFEADLTVSNALITMYAKCGSIEDAYQMFKGRAGRLPEAMDFIKNSPFPNSPLLWRTLVSVCKLQGDLDFGMLASKNLLDLSPEEAGS